MESIEIGDRVFCEKKTEATECSSEYDEKNKCYIVKGLKPSEQTLRFNGIVKEIRPFHEIPADLLILDCDGSHVSVRSKHVVKVEKSKVELADKF